VIRLTAGNVSDIRAASGLLASIHRPARLIADKGYDSDALRKALTESGTKPKAGAKRRNRSFPDGGTVSAASGMTENAIATGILSKTPFAG